MLNRRTTITLGALAVLGHGFGILADIATGYAPGVEIDLDSIASISLANIAPLLQAKPLDEVRLGHYLAIFFIPLGLFGIWQVYRGLRPHRNRLALPFLLVGVFGLIHASFFHGTLGFLAGALQAQQDIGSANAWSETIAFFNSLSEPLGITLLLVDVAASLLFSANVWLKQTYFPRWMAAINPLSIQLLLSLIIWLAPHPLEQLLWLTVFNASLTVWYVATTVVLSRTRQQIGPVVAKAEAVAA